VSIEAFNLLKSHIREPITLIDAGARWGAVDLWASFGDKATIFCFEADEEEAVRLNATNSRQNVEYIPFALGAASDTLSLTLTKGPGCSSVYEPIRILYEEFPACDIMSPVRTTNCQSISIDEFCEGRGLNKIHALKLDTQGSELDILKGADRTLQQCLFINVEVEFNPLYEKQPLFCDVDRFLRDRGFVLWRLNNLAHYSKGVIAGESHPILLAAEPGSHQYVSLDNGQLFWADAFYVREAAIPTNRQTLDFDDAVAGACLVSQWRLWDLAIEMIRKSGADELLAQLSSLVPQGAPQRTLSEENEALRQQVDGFRREVEGFKRESVELREEIDALRRRVGVSGLMTLFKRK
jgi:FkbM family methyltransferase